MIWIGIGLNKQTGMMRISSADQDEQTCIELTRFKCIDCDEFYCDNLNDGIELFHERFRRWLKSHGRDDRTQQVIWKLKELISIANSRN